MPAPESSSTGPSAAPNACSSSRKEKKKQAKEERDRLKQVEKKKRRLEKALATAAAIRIELEKKKQKRKEEEQRLDEEGAALAEAVALQVLVDEDVDILEESTSTNNVVVEEEETSQLSLEDNVEKAGNPQTSSGQSLDIKQEIYYTYIAAVSTAEYSTGNSDWEVSMNHTSRHANNDKFGKFEALQVERVVVSDEEIFSNLEDNLKASNERAKAAEVTAGMAAAQAVAALRIAEEARAEAEAAKKAAEAAINQFLDRKQLSHVDEGVLQINYQPKNIEMERDELKARLEETEHQLKEKTRQVVCLEQSLEDMTQYLLQLNTTLPFVTGGGERECLTLERDCTSVTESSGGTVDQ